MNCSSFILAFLALLGYTAADMVTTTSASAPDPVPYTGCHSECAFPQPSDPLQRRYCGAGDRHCHWCADCGTSCPPACYVAPPPAPTPPAPVWEYCTTHAKCRDLHKDSRHSHFCHGWSNVTGVCMECTQCQENTSPFTGNCQDACGHDPVHDPDSLCRRDEDCSQQSFCDWESRVHDKESVWHRCSPCSLHEKDYDKHRKRCARFDTRRPTTADAPTDVPTQPPTLPPTPTPTPPPTPPPKKKKPSTVDRIHKELEDQSNTMEGLSNNTSFIKWLLVVIIIIMVVGYFLRHCPPVPPLLPRYQLRQRQDPVRHDRLDLALSPPVNPVNPVLPSATV